MVLDVVARSDAEQVHMRRFEISVEPAAAVDVRCSVKGDATEKHARTWDAATHIDGSLFGLLADTTYDCAITARRQGKKLTGELSFTTDEQGADLPPMDLSFTGDPWGDYTVFNTWRSGGGGSDHQVLIVDDRARVRWHLAIEDDSSVGLEVRPAGRRSLWIGGGKIPPQKRALGGTVLWSFPTLDDKQTYWHHEAHPTPQGTLLGLQAEANSNGQRQWEGFRIVERDPDQGEVWSWDSQSAFDAGTLPNPGGNKDPWHANAVSQIEGGDVLVSLPGIDRVLRIDKSSGSVAWQFGRGLDFGMVSGWFSGQHDPELLGDRLLMHDNGVLGGESRLVEYALNDATAQVVWEWTEPGWFEPLWGDADRLPNGTVLVARGHCGFCADAGSGASSIRILDPATDAITWELAFPDRNWATYRAERVDGCDLFDNDALCGAR